MTIEKQCTYEPQSLGGVEIRHCAWNICCMGKNWIEHSNRFAFPKRRKDFSLIERVDHFTTNLMISNSPTSFSWRIYMFLDIWIILILKSFLNDPELQFLFFIPITCPLKSGSLLKSKDSRSPTWQFCNLQFSLQCKAGGRWLNVSRFFS